MKRSSTFAGLTLALLFCSISFAIIPSGAEAAVPKLINFQGILKDGSGNPVANGSYSVIFTIYDDPSAGNILWAETTSVSTTSGLFTVLLGSTNPVSDSAFQDTSRYLGVKVGADPEMSPRQKLVSVGYAYESAQWTSAAQNLFRLNGNVGIGTTDLQSPFVVQGASNWGVAEVVGNDGFNNEASIGFRPSNLSKGALGTWVLGVNNNAGLANAFSLYVANGFGAGSQAISVLTSGNVGIGAFNPLQKLHVQGNGYFSGNLGVGTSSPAAQLHVHDQSGTINGSRLMLTQTATGSTIFDGTALICGSPNRAFLWNYENGPSIFGTNNAERMRIDSTGNVGIGTANPETKLHVSGSAEGLRIQGTGVGNPGGAYASFTDAAGTPIGYVGDGSSSDQDMYVTSYIGRVHLYTPVGAALTAAADGRVGIGTTTPSYKLHVDGGGATAVYGTTTGSGTGVWGNSPNFIGVRGTSVDNNGVYGSSSSGNAGRFDGSVQVNGTLTKTAGSFKIDHPTDPANKYLYHSFVESPDMKNIYDGVVTTDAKGNATVSLAEWFGALNRDFRYQLTVIGQFAQAIVSKKIENNQFSIKTDKPNIEVSWQVTGIRKDAYANAHRIPVEEVKPDKERGFYIHPELFGQPEEKGTEWANYPEMMKEMKELREKAKEDK